MVSEFKWPSEIPSGQRTYKTPSCLIRKSISNIILFGEDDLVIDLLDENSKIDENDRLSLITGAIGVFSGSKNTLYGGFIKAAANNSRETLNPWEIKAEENPYYNCAIYIRWSSKDKKNIVCEVDRLMDLVYSFDYILEDDVEAIKIYLN